MKFDLIYGEIQYASTHLNKFSENEIEDLMKKAKKIDADMLKAFNLGMSEYKFENYAENLLKNAIEKRKKKIDD